MSGTGGWVDDVAFGSDIGAACSAGVGGVPSAQDGDFVYQITLGYGNNVDCTFTSYLSAWVFALSTSCGDPLGAGNCAWGQVVPQGGSASFNTAALGLEPGTYYLWFDQAVSGDGWQIVCSGEIGAELIFADGVESGDTTHWSATSLPP